MSRQTATNNTSRSDATELLLLAENPITDAILPTADTDPITKEVDSTNLFTNSLDSAELDKPKPKYLAINSQAAREQTFIRNCQEALSKLDELKQDGLITEEMAKTLGEKVTGSGKGLLGRITPQRLLATLDNIEDLKSRGLAPEDIRSKTDASLRRGGITSLDITIHALQQQHPEKAQTSQAKNPIPETPKNANQSVPIPATKLDLHNPFLDPSYRDRFLPSIESIDNSNSNPGLTKLLDFISKGEGGYNSMNQGTSGNRIVGSTHDASTLLGRDLTSMTIGEVMSLQSSGKLFAAGRYQIIPSTMREVMSYSDLKPSDMFSAENQDKLAVALIYEKRPYLGAYLKGEHNDLNGAALEAAREWASLPNPYTGRSHYGNGNRSSHSVAEVKAALTGARK
jgi:hypothetical protein